ncbi:MAG: sugar ABC transporter permease [Caldisphaeraceae archaeon]|nr:sugar ABC transporter permease [Caldisphaeraceae archaeon]
MRKGALIMAIPTLFFSGVLLYLVAWNIYLSFLNWSLVSRIPKFVGFGTYSYLLHQYFFKIGAMHSAIFSLGLIAIGNPLGIFLAGILYFLPNKFRTLMVSIFLYPLAISMATNGLIWTWLFNLHLGVDYALRLIHLPTIPWLTTPTTTIGALFLVEIWAYTGLAVLFYLASFMGVDKSIIEAARIDKAGGFKILFKILIPNSMNGFIVSTALLFLFSFRLFSLPYVIGGGPTNLNLMTLVTYLYYLFYSEFFSASAATSVIVTVVATAVIIPYALYGIKRWIRRE